MAKNRRRVGIRCARITRLSTMFSQHLLSNKKIPSCSLIDSYFDFGFLIWVYMLWLKSQQTDMVGFGLALADFIVIRQDASDRLR